MKWYERQVPVLVVLLLLAMFALAMHGSFRNSSDLRRICELLGEHTFSYAHPQTPQEEIDTICLRHEEEADDRPD